MLLIFAAIIAMIVAVWFALHLQSSWQPEPTPSVRSHGGRVIATGTPEIEPVIERARTGTSSTSRSSSELQIFGSIPYWDQPRAIKVFKENVEVFDIISVFWYHLDDGGNIVTYDYAKEDASLITFAHEHDVKVLALIANLPEEGDWDAWLVENVIEGESARAKHIADILALIKKHNFDGVNIDYEFLRDRQTEDYTAFIEELGAALHKEGKILSIAIHAQEPGGETRGQDLKALHKHVDILSFMTYDEHWETGSPGPVASLPWVRSVLEYARDLGVPSKKIFMGIPLYGYDWAEGKERADGIEYEEVVARANKYDTDVLFDETAQSPYFSYEVAGTKHRVWFENVKSFGPKFELAKEFGVGGIMFWRQGREDMRIYGVLGE